MVKAKNRVHCLNNGKGKEEDCGNEGDNGPRVPEVGVDEVGPPLVPGLLAVVAEAHLHHVQHALAVHGDVLGQRVEQLRHVLVAPQGVH